MSNTTPATASDAVSNDDLTQIIPPIGTRKFNGVDVKIERFKMGRLPAVLAAIAPLKEMLTLKDKLDITSLFMLHADECLTLTAVLANQPRAFVDELELDEGVELLTELLEVNADFFIQQVLPLLTGMFKKIAAELTQRAEALGLNNSNS